MRGEPRQRGASVFGTGKTPMGEARVRIVAAGSRGIGAYLGLSLDLGIGIQLQLARRALGSPAHRVGWVVRARCDVLLRGGVSVTKSFKSRNRLGGVIFCRYFQP